MPMQDVFSQLPPAKRSEEKAYTSPQVSLQAIAWLASCRKTVMSLKGVIINVLHSCHIKREKINIR